MSYLTELSAPLNSLIVRLANGEVLENCNILEFFCYTRMETKNNPLSLQQLAIESLVNNVSNMCYFLMTYPSYDDIAHFNVTMVQPCLRHLEKCLRRTIPTVLANKVNVLLIQRLQDVATKAEMNCEVCSEWMQEFRQARDKVTKCSICDSMSIESIRNGICFTPHSEDEVQHKYKAWCRSIAQSLAVVAWQVLGNELEFDTVPTLLTRPLIQRLNNMKTLRFRLAYRHKEDDIDVIVSRLNLLKCLQVTPDLKEFQHHNCSDRELHALCNNCPRLQVLDLSGSRKLTNNCIPSIFRLRFLEELHLDSTNFNSDGYTTLLIQYPDASANLLKKLSIILFSTTHLELISARFANLRSLKVECLSIQSASLQHLQLLSELSISGLDFTAGLQVIGPQITYLNIENAVPIDLKFLDQFLPNLQHLSFFRSFMRLQDPPGLHSVRKVTVEQLPWRETVALVAQFSNLRSLHITTKMENVFVPLVGLIKTMRHGGLEEIVTVWARLWIDGDTLSVKFTDKSCQFVDNMESFNRFISRFRILMH